MESVLFHGIGKLTDAERESGNVREFVGDGTPLLPAPGLVELLGVRIGRTDIPMTMVQQFPVSLVQEVPPISMPLPMLGLELAADGTPIVLRSKQSNDGIWQKGERVYVRGRWQDDGAPEAPPVTTGRGRKEPSA